MATVYLATDLSANREVAIKVVDPEVAAAVGAERFHREIRIASARWNWDARCSPTSASPGWRRMRRMRRPSRAPGRRSAPPT
jgi:hypothetical protein